MWKRTIIGGHKAHVWSLARCDTVRGEHASAARTRACGNVGITADCRSRLRLREKAGRGPLSTRERMATRDHRWPQGITYGHCARHSDVVGPRIRRCTHQRRARGSPVATGDHHLMTHSREMLGPRGCAYFAGHAPRMATRDHRWSQGITYGHCARLSEFPLARIRREARTGVWNAGSPVATGVTYGHFLCNGLARSGFHACPGWSRSRARAGTASRAEAAGERMFCGHAGCVWPLLVRSRSMAQ